MCCSSCGPHCGARPARWPSYDIESLLSAKQASSQSKSPAGAAAAAGRAGGGQADASKAAATTAAAGAPRHKVVTRAASDVGVERQRQAEHAAANSTRQLSAEQRPEHLAMSLEVPGSKGLSSSVGKQSSKGCLTSDLLPQVQQECSSPWPSSRPIQGGAAVDWAGDSCAETGELEGAGRAPAGAGRDDDEPYYEGEKSFYVEHSASTTDGRFGLYRGDHDDELAGNRRRELHWVVTCGQLDSSG